MTCKGYLSKYKECTPSTRQTLLCRIMEISGCSKNRWHNWENTALIVLELKLPGVTLVSHCILFQSLSTCLFLESYFCGGVTIAQNFLDASVLVLSIRKACYQNVYRSFDNDLYSMSVFPYFILYISHILYIPNIYNIYYMLYIPILYIIHSTYYVSHIIYNLCISQYILIVDHIY